MNGLDLFSGIGGIALAIRPWVKTVAYCEQDKYAQGVLLSRMRSGELDCAPIWTDVRTLRKEQFSEPIDFISGGFPCQDISTAGTGEGLEGKRSGLFYEIVRLTDDLRPQFVFLENVAAITVRGLDQVIGEFSKLRYDCRWTIVSAAELGALHVRKRWFMLARNTLENPECNRLEESGNIGISRERQANSIADASWWAIEPNVGRVANGVPFRVDRIRCLGNAVVPAQGQEAFKRLIGLK